MKNIKIGSRLALAFSAILVLSVSSMIFSVVRFQSVERLTDHMVSQSVAKERYVNELYGSIQANIVRIVAAAKNPDVAQQKYYKDQVRATIGVNTELFKVIGELVQDPEGRALLDEIQRNREAILKSNTAIFVEKAASREYEALKLVDERLVPEGEIYLKNIKRLAELQRSEVIDNIQKIDTIFLSTMRSLAIFGTVVMVAGALLSYRITTSITNPLRTAIGVAVSVSEGDFTISFPESTKDETGQLIETLKKMTESLSSMAFQIRKAATSINGAADRFAQSNTYLQNRTELQASSLEETASSMEELTSTVAQNAENAREANRYASSASEVALEGGKVVQQVIATMTDINDSSKKIVEITGVIDSIAFQTNILALNAAVEAARAGEQGRGFAIVAAEVRSLAHRSSLAAKDIKQLIGDSAQKVDAGGLLVEQAGVTMRSVVESVRKATDVVAEISAASREQSVGLEEINQAISLMDKGTQENAALVESGSDEARSLQGDAATLVQAVAVFKLRA